MTTRFQFNVYEEDFMLAEYLLFHYGSKKDVCPYSFGPKRGFFFHKQCVELARRWVGKKKAVRALDLGCSVGRACFELARFCSEVVGIDFSRNFIEAAKKLQQEGSCRIQKVEEGFLRTSLRLKIPFGRFKNRIRFLRGDACALPQTIGRFDLVTAINLIDRLTNPKKCLKRLPLLVNPRGILLIVSPYTWMEEFTPVKNWLGGFVRKGRTIRTLERLQNFFASTFTLKAQEDISFLYREHQRKFQWGIAEATVWQRKKN